MNYEEFILAQWYILTLIWHTSPFVFLFHVVVLSFVLDKIIKRL